MRSNRPDVRLAVRVVLPDYVSRATGRPVETRQARMYDRYTVKQTPGPSGAHNWQPMSFNPQTKLVYIPAQLTSQLFAFDQTRQVKPGVWNTGLDFGALSTLTMKALLAGAVKAVATDLSDGDRRGPAEHADFPINKA